MKAIGVICYSAETVKTHLESNGIKVSVYPKTSGDYIISDTVEKFLLVAKKTKGTDKVHVVLDTPTFVHGLGLKWIGAIYQMGGVYVRRPLQFPKQIPEFQLDQKSLITKIAIKNVKKHIAKETK